MAEDVRDHAGTWKPDGDANRPVAPSARGKVRHHAVDAHCTQDEGQTSQEREQGDDLPRGTEGRLEHAAHRRRLLQRGRGSHAGDRASRRFQERRLGDAGRDAEDDGLCVFYPGYLGQRDLWAAMLMPYFNATDKLQLVTRYTLVDSDGLNGISLNTYENRVVNRAGDRYNEGYAGVNYFFYGHRLKVQTGMQYADMRDRADDGGAYAGLSWTAGVRVGW